MKISEITLLFDYNYWANKKILVAAKHVNQSELVAPRPHSYESLLNTLLHILEAEYSWRWLLRDNIFIEALDPAEFADLSALQDRWQEEETAMYAYLAELNDADMTNIIRYTPAGERPRARVLWHCFVHVVNHGTQHRGEAAAILTEVGHSPGELDFTIYLTEMGH